MVAASSQSNPTVAGVPLSIDGSRPYLQYFGLQEQPFAPTADPSYFYSARGHQECLLRLWSSVDERQGIAVVLGNYGTGKTTLVRKLLAGVHEHPERYSTAVVASPLPSWTSFALLESIVAQFGLRPAQYTFESYIDALNRHLVEERGRISTLIIDDAQNLNKRGQLELLRLVQNLETQQHKLLNLVLFAQLEWLSVLEAAPNFAQRVNLTYTLEPLDLAETGAFIEHRLDRACGDPMRRPHFDDDAVRAIFVYAEGSPRVIVNLCRNALLLAARLQTNVINVDIVLHTIDKTTMPDPAKRQALAETLGLAAPPTRAIANATPRAGSERVLASKSIGQESAPFPASPDTEAAPAALPMPPGPPTSRDARAAELLLRAARTRQSG